MHKPLSVCMLACLLIAAGRLPAQESGRPLGRVTPAGEVPADARLGKPRTLNAAYHPWTPAATLEGWQQQAEAIRQSSEQAVETFMFYAYRQMPSDQLAEYAALYEHASVSQLLAISLEVVPQLFAERREQLRKTALRP